MTGCRNTRWKRCSRRNWTTLKRRRAARLVGDRRHARRDGRAGVDCRGGRAGPRGAVRRLCRRLRRRALAGARAGRHIAQRHGVRSVDGADGVPLARIPRTAETVSGAFGLSRDASGLSGLLAVLRPHRCRREFLFPRADPARHQAREFRFHGAAAPRRRFRFRLRVRLCRLLGVAQRSGGNLPGRPRADRGRCRAQPSALRRLRPQQRAGGRGQSRLEARREARRLGRRRAAALVLGRTPSGVPRRRRGLHRQTRRPRRRISRQA